MGTLTLRESRRRHGISQKTLASLAFLTQTTISLIECGRKSPFQSTKNRIEHVLGQEISWSQTLKYGSTVLTKFGPKRYADLHPQKKIKLKRRTK